MESTITLSAEERQSAIEGIIRRLNELEEKYKRKISLDLGVKEMEDCYKYDLSEDNLHEQLTDEEISHIKDGSYYLFWSIYEGVVELAWGNIIFQDEAWTIIDNDFTSDSLEDLTW